MILNNLSNWKVRWYNISWPFLYTLVQFFFLYSFDKSLLSLLCVCGRTRKNVLNRCPLIIITLFSCVLFMLYVFDSSVFYCGSGVSWFTFFAFMVVFSTWLVSTPLFSFVFKFLLASNGYNLIVQVDWCYHWREIDRFLVTVIFTRANEEINALKIVLFFLRHVNSYKLKRFSFYIALETCTRVTFTDSRV